MEFSKPIADATNYPRPCIKVVPNNELSGKKTSKNKPIGVSEILLVDRARSGFFLLAKSIPADTIWCPEYHCPALIEPFLAAGKAIKFYPINNMLEADINFLEEHLQSSDVLVGVRFFGFLLNIPELANLCKTKDAILIEDLAHAAYPHELYGDAGVTSLVKFLPISNGAEIMLTHRLSVANIVEKYHKSLPNVYEEKIRFLWHKAKTKFYRSGVNTYLYFDVNKISKNLKSNTQSIISHYNHERNQQLRRLNFNFLVRNTADSSLGKPLFLHLGDTDVPYALPFLLNKSQGFDFIRNKALQIFRWEELETSVRSSIVLNYLNNLVQIPTHQDLSEEELELIVRILK